MPQKRGALDSVATVLENRADEVHQVDPTDELLIIDNHISLHRRTAFTDPRGATLCGFGSTSRPRPTAPQSRAACKKCRLWRPSLFYRRRIGGSLPCPRWSHSIVSLRWN